MSYVRTLTICLLLVCFVSAVGCHCFDLFHYKKFAITFAVKFASQRQTVFGGKSFKFIHLILKKFSIELNRKVVQIPVSGLYLN